MERLTVRDMDNLPAYLTPKEVQKIIPISIPRLYQLINQKDCPKFSNGSRWILPTVKFLKYIETKDFGL